MLVSQIETPALILDMDRFESNVRLMKDFTESIGVKLRPHYKSHKCTTIAHMQMEAGAKGLCCAKESEASDLVQAGIDDVLIANQVVDPGKITRVATLAHCCHLMVCVDSAQNIEDLNAAASLQKSTIHCLIEYNVGMNRCGVRSYEQCFELAKQVEKAPRLSFEGIQAYAGHIAHLEDYTKRQSHSEEIERDLSGLKKYLQERGLSVKEISGVSTGAAFMRTPNSIYTEIQAGSYIFMDTSYGALNLDFQNALFVLSSILGIRNGRMIFDTGTKSMGMDQRRPVFFEHPDVTVQFNEEHCSIPEKSGCHQIGDTLKLIPGHCCTTVNLHDFIYFTREEKVVDRVPITSRGKSL